MAVNPIRLRPTAIVLTLTAVAFVLVLASIAGQLVRYLLGHDTVFGLIGLFYVDGERNIPTAFSVMLLFFAALLLASITILKNLSRDPYATGWAVLTFGFLFMAVDEESAIHAKLVEPVRKLLGEGPLGIFYFAWVIPGILLVCLLLLFYLKFLCHLPSKTRRMFLVAAILFLGGSIGIELVGGFYAELYGQRNLTYSMIATLEESLEMAGAILFVYALLIYIAESYTEVRFRFDELDQC